MGYELIIRRLLASAGPDGFTFSSMDSYLAQFCGIPSSLLVVSLLIEIDGVSPRRGLALAQCNDEDTH